MCKFVLTSNVKNWIKIYKNICFWPMLENLFLCVIFITFYFSSVSNFHYFCIILWHIYHDSANNTTHGSHVIENNPVGNNMQINALLGCKINWTWNIYCVITDWNISKLICNVIFPKFYLIKNSRFIFFHCHFQRKQHLGYALKKK